MTSSKLAERLVALLGLASLTAPVLGDGSVIDKIYHPYVEQLEWELEWRMSHENENPQTGIERGHTHKVGLGHGIGEYLFTEVYLIGQRSADDSLDLYAYEVEALWQLSDQGEYVVDYGC